MKLNVIYNTSVNPYRFDNVEMAPFSHPITFDNKFQYDWEKIGTWYMGNCYIHGVGNLTRKELSQILTKAEENLNEYISGNTLEDIIQAIKKCMNVICEFIKTNSPISLGEVFWESHIRTRNIGVLL
jgi:hypothetical protein